MLFNTCTDQTEAEPEVLEYLMRRYSGSTSTEDLSHLYHQTIPDTTEDPKQPQQESSLTANDGQVVAVDKQEVKEKVYHGSDYNPEMTEGLAVAFGTIGGIVLLILSIVICFWLQNKYSVKKAKTHQDLAQQPMSLIDQHFHNAELEAAQVAGRPPLLTP